MNAFCVLSHYLSNGACLFFPDLHADCYVNVAGLSECGYRAMSPVEQMLVGYLSPGAALSLKAPVLPSKPLRTTSALVGKGYVAVGQAGACLQMMSVLQAYQADLLKELDEGEQVSSNDIVELSRTADLALRATKETVRAIGRSITALVAAERHLWLTLSNMKEKDRVFLMDTLLVPSGLFGDSVDSVVDRYQEARKQAAAFKRSLPRHSIVLRAAGRELLIQGDSKTERCLSCSPAAGTRTTTLLGLLGRSPIWGSCFSLGSPRQSGPDIYSSGLLRVAPAGEERSAPHYTVSVSPQRQPCQISRAQQSPASASLSSFRPES